MGLQFLLMHHANRSDPAPRARAAQVWRAWWRELGVVLVVFCWRQPFRSQSMPDALPSAPNGRRGVVLVHWRKAHDIDAAPWLQQLRAALDASP